LKRNDLKRLPIDTLKPDWSCSTDLDRDPDALAMIVTAVVVRVRPLGLSVVAEGVETHRQARLLRRER
jgi:EAL domain-containing protein (putative c-di-GMP-specific phosphodiesterase class I)